MFTTGLAVAAPVVMPGPDQLNVYELPVGEALSVCVVAIQVIEPEGLVLTETAVVLVGTNDVMVEAQPLEVLVTTHV